MPASVSVTFPTALPPLSDVVSPNFVTGGSYDTGGRESFDTVTVNVWLKKSDGSLVSLVDDQNNPISQPVPVSNLPTPMGPWSCPIHVALGNSPGIDDCEVYVELAIGNPPLPSASLSGIDIRSSSNGGGMNAPFPPPFHPREFFPRSPRPVDLTVRTPIKVDHIEVYSIRRTNRTEPVGTHREVHIQTISYYDAEQSNSVTETTMDLPNGSPLDVLEWQIKGVTHPCCESNSPGKFEALFRVVAYAANGKIVTAFTDGSFQTSNHHVMKKKKKS